MKIDAILWDYDGTLVNSIPKNIDITKQILSVVAPRLTGKQLPKSLKTEKDYHTANHQSKNWQDLYINFYGMTESEMLSAGNLWAEYQLKNDTPVELFSGIKDTIEKIAIPQGICSQNSSENIALVLEKYNLSHKFESIIGYDDIPSNMQKPSSFSGIKCLNQIFNSFINKTIIYIGDHEGDVEFARNIEKKLQHKNNVISIIVKYSGASTNSWTYKPDYELESPTDLLTVINNSTV
ncbi:MAG: phosphatase [Lutibacter sp.]|nr:MAG: phosphatase [Lutibacter sp.]